MENKYRLSEKAVNFFREYGIGIVYLFGSRAEGSHKDDSDFDTGIVFTDAKNPEDILELHPKLYCLFSNEFPVAFDRDVDILYMLDCGPAFRYSVISTGSVLYEVSFEFRAEYEKRTMMEYLDFKPISDIFSKSLMER